MVLTEAQYVVLATNIVTTNAAEFAAMVAGNRDPEIAAAYNVPAAPVYWVWKTSLSKAELLYSTSVDATTFNFQGNGFITRAPGELEAFKVLFDPTNDLTNPSLPQVRSAFADIFSGAGNAVANRTHLLAVARRQATRIERLFATGTGSTASPGTMTAEGFCTHVDIAHALRGVAV